MRAPSQYVCSLDNQRTEAPSGRVSRTWRLATSISVTSLEPTLKTYTVSRPSAPPAVADCAGAELVCEALDGPQVEAMSPSAALPAPLRTVRRSRLEERNQFEPPTNTPVASPREAQSSGAQCEEGWADARGFTIAFDIVRLLQGPDLHATHPRVCRKSLPVKRLSAHTDAMRGNLLSHRRSLPGRLLCGRGAGAVIPIPRKRGWSAHGTLAPEVRARRVVMDPAGRGRAWRGGVDRHPQLLGPEPPARDEEGGAGILLSHRKGARDRRHRQGDRGGASGFDRLCLERHQCRRGSGAPDTGQPRPDQNGQAPQRHGAGQARAPVGSAGDGRRVADRLRDGRTRLITLHLG